MGLEVDSEEQLFLLEIVIESVTLRLDCDNGSYDSQEDPPWVVCFRLCDTFSFEVKQEDEEKTEESICPRTKECTVNFHSGKSCLFTANPLRFLQVIQENPIYVTVCTQYPDSVTSDILGIGEIEFDDSMISELCTSLKQDSGNSETSCKGCYPLCDKQLQVGAIKLYLRLSFYGKCILSEFKLLSGMDNILFKVQDDDERNKCTKCGKAKVKPTASEDSECDFSDSSFLDVDQPWQNTYDRQTNYPPGASKPYGGPDYLNYGKGNMDPCYTPTFTSKYDSYRRSDDMLRLDSILKKDAPRQSFNQARESSRPTYRLSGVDQDGLLMDKHSNDSIDFRNIIGEEIMKYPSTDDAISYIAPMLDVHEKTYTIDELKVKKAPKLKAGPKRRKKLKSTKFANFEPGVKIGHKECVKQTKNVPKRSGWLWPEKTKKTPGWKPGSVSRKVAEMLQSSRIDGETGKGDFDKKRPSIKEDEKEETRKMEYANPIANDNEQPSLHFKMCGGSYMISVNPAALGDKSNRSKNQNGLFMRLNKKEEGIDSSSSDIEIAFTTPRVKCEPPAPVEAKENIAQCFADDTSRGKQWPEFTKGKDDEKDEGVGVMLLGGKGRVDGIKRMGNQNKIDAKERNVKNEKGIKEKASSEGDSPKITVWDGDQDTAVGNLRSKPVKKK